MEDEEYKKLAVEDQCVHKLWQVRKQGYEEAAKIFRRIDDEKSPEFGKYLGLVHNFVIDSHAVCQEKGLQATLAFIENYAHAGRTVGEVMFGVVSKCIAAPRLLIRELAGQVILMYIEKQKGEAVQEELLKGMEHKNPKIVAACITAYTTALREFGTKIINVKPAVKKIEVLCSHRDNTVRNEASIMVVEIYRWIGVALRSQLNNLKPVQLSELEAEFTKVEGQKAIPSRYIRSKHQKQISTPIESQEIDCDPTVRNILAEALGTLMEEMRGKSIEPFLDELKKDPLKLAKIRECCEKVVATVKIAAPKKETAPVKAAAAPTKPKPVASPKSTPTRKNIAPKKRTLNSATFIRSKSKTASKKTVERELGDDEVDQILKDIVSANMVKEMSDSNYKTRVVAVDTFFQAIKHINSGDIRAQALVKCVNKKPGLKDTNFQVIQIKLEIIKYLATNSTFSTTTANVCFNDIMEKFGDAKNGTLAQETITAIAESTSLAFVSAATVNFLKNQKSPKIIIETLAWLGSAIKDFGFKDLNQKLLIDFGKRALSSSNAGVRRAAISFCGVLFLYVQHPLYACFENEKAILRNQINAEFDKLEGVKPPVPTKGIAKCASSNSPDNLDEEEDTGDSNLNHIKRVDISNQLDESLLKQLEDENWKVRLEALTKITEILQNAKSIKPDLGDLPQSLTRRLSDSNKQVVQTALNVCKNIAEAMGAPCKRYIKVFFLYFLRNWADYQPQLKAAAKETIDTYVQRAGSYKKFFENEMIFEALKTGTQQLKTELWTWLSEILPKIPVNSIPKAELVICIPLLYSDLENPSVDVRWSSQKAILGLMIHVGYDEMVNQMENLKPASRYDVRKKLDNVKENLTMQSTPKKVAEEEKKTDTRTEPSPNTKDAIKPKILGEEFEDPMKHSKRIVIFKPEAVPQVIQPKELNPEAETDFTQPELNDEEEEKENNQPSMVVKSQPPKMVQNAREQSMDSELSGNLDKMVNCFKAEKVNFHKDDANIPTLSLTDFRARVGLLSQNFNYENDEENEYFRNIVMQLRHLKKDPDSNHQVSEYLSVTVTIDAFYRMKHFAPVSVSVENLKDIVDELIQAWVDIELKNRTDGYFYVREIHLQCMQILEKSDHTRTICALIKLLHQCVRMDSLARRTELVMKCLQKVIKMMTDWGEDVEYDAVLLEIHVFLKKFPSTWWKDKPMNDAPLRTIKTTLYSCVQIRGAAIMSDFDKISNPSESEIKYYVQRVLKSMNLEVVPI